MFNAQNHWRNTARAVRFFNVDARAAGFLLLFLIHIRLWTFILAILSVVFFAILERFGLTVPLAMRRVRVWFIGQKRPALLKINRREFKDYGGF